MNGQFFAPAKTALPPSLAVVYRGAMDSKERVCSGRSQASYPTLVNP